MTLPLKRKQLHLLPEPPKRMVKRLPLHIDHPAVLNAKQQQHGRLYVAHVRDGRGRVQLCVQFGSHLLALRRWTHAELVEVPVWDVRACRLRADDGVAQYRRGERVWVLPDDYRSVSGPNAITACMVGGSEKTWIRRSVFSHASCTHDARIGIPHGFHRLRIASLGHTLLYPLSQGDPL
jgi:hypothetical protein